MNVNDIEDVLNLGTILSTYGSEDVAHQPYLLAALLDWKNGNTGEAGFIANQDEPPAPGAAGLVEPDPEPEPPAPAKKAPAKAPAKAAPKSKAKPAPADDDDADF